MLRAAAFRDATFLKLGIASDLIDYAKTLTDAKLDKTFILRNVTQLCE